MNTAVIEKDVATDCDELAQSIGCRVERYEQQRPAMITIGLPDRRYVHSARGVRVWVELKRPPEIRHGKKGQRIKGAIGQLTEAQHTWLLCELNAEGLATCIDDVEQLQKLFNILAGGRVGRMQEAQLYCRSLLEQMRLRGFRRAKA